MRVVNLARRPFVNRRPVVRLTVLLWLLGVLLLAANLWLYGSYWTNSAEMRGQLAAIAADHAREQERFDKVERQAARLELEELNARTEFLNRLIRNRTFPWNELFEDLEEVLPRGVRLTSVQPTVRVLEQTEEVRPAPTSLRRSAKDRERRRPTGSRRDAPTDTAEREAAGPATLHPDEVSLNLSGSAKSDEELMAFVDALYASPDFRSPFLPGEMQDKRGGVSFNLQVVYLTRLPAEPAAEEAAEVAAAAPTPAAPTEAAEVAAGAGEEATGSERVVAAGAGAGEEERAIAPETPVPLATGVGAPPPTAAGRPLIRRSPDPDRASARVAGSSSPGPSEDRPRAARPSSPSGVPVVLPGAVAGTPRAVRETESDPNASATPDTGARTSWAPTYRADAPPSGGSQDKTQPASRRRSEASKPSAPSFVTPSASATPRLRRPRAGSGGGAGTEASR